jgi:hypothetical protein
MAAETQGTLVLFRGQQIRIRISTSAPSLDLVSGGFSQKQNWRLRFPGTITPAPTALEKVKDVASGKTYVIRGVVPANSNALASEHIAEAEWQ